MHGSRSASAASESQFVDRSITQAAFNDSRQVGLGLVVAILAIQPKDHLILQQVLRSGTLARFVSGRHTVRPPKALHNASDLIGQKSEQGRASSIFQFNGVWRFLGCRSVYRRRRRLRRIDITRFFVKMSQLLILGSWVRIPPGSPKQIFDLTGLIPPSRFAKPEPLFS
jgi:hypothetical protein